MANPVVKKSDLDLALARAKSNPGDYTALTNKPSINNVTLVGNKTAADLGLVQAVNGKGLSTNDYTTAEKNKLAGIETGAEVNAIDGITFNGNPVPVTNKIAAIQSIGDVQDVMCNGSSVVTNGIAYIPLANGNTWGLVNVSGATQPGSSYMTIERMNSGSPGTYTYTVPTTNLNGTILPTYLPDATYTQKGAVKLNNWEGTLTDNISEVENEGYDSTLGGIGRTVTTTSGNFSLVSGNRVTIKDVGFWGYQAGDYPHFLNIDNTGYVELRYAPGYPVSKHKYELLVSGTIEVVYDGTYYIIVNGFSFEKPTTPAATSTTWGIVKVGWLNEPGGKYVVIQTGDMRYLYIPLLEANQSQSYSGGKIRGSYVDYPVASSSVAGLIKVTQVTEPPAGYIFFKSANDDTLACAPLLEYSNGAYQPIRARWLPDATSSAKGAVIVDNDMSDSSTNPVQNSVVKAYIDSHAGGGGITDVTVNGSSVVSNNVAVITVPDEAQSISYDDTNNDVLQGQNVQDVIDGIDWLLDTMSMPANPSQNGRYFHTVTKATGSITYGWTTLDASDIPVDDTNFTEISAQDVQTAIEGLDDNIGHLWGDIAQTIETVKVNGTALVKTNKAVNIDLSGYLLTSDEITEAQIDAMFV